MADEQKTEQKTAQKKKGTLGGCLTLIILVLVVAYFLGDDDAGKNAPVKDDITISDNMPSEQKRELEKQIIDGYVVKSFGPEVNWGNKMPRVQKIEAFPMYDSEGNIKTANISIWLNINENISNSMTRKGAFMYGWKTFKAIYTDPRLKEVDVVTIVGCLQFVDPSGNKTAGKAIQFTMNKKLAAQIPNWDNVSSDDYQQIYQAAGDVWMHPALRKD